ncbi:MAG: Na/Pi symporter [Candidatus Bathyarchaeia archaeon]
MEARYKTSIFIILSAYFFISSIVLIKSSAVALGRSLAEALFFLVKDTTSGVFVGWLSTALLHSSGAFDSIIVAFVSAGVIPLKLAVAAILGAEVGTTVTPLTISILGYIRRRSQLSASFNVSMTHFLYNLLTLLLFYFLELSLGVFTRIAEFGRGIFVKASWLSLIPDLLELVTPWVDLLMGFIPGWLGIVLGCLILLASLWAFEHYMTATFSMPRSWNLIRATFMKPLRAFIAGFLFTVLVPSTTVMVSLLVPLAASGVIGPEHYILPYILGANIGTVFDVMMAALATGDPAALSVWLVHLSNNLIGALIFLPFMKPFSRLVRKVSSEVSSSAWKSLLFIGTYHLIPILIISSYILRR